MVFPVAVLESRSDHVVVEADRVELERMISENGVYGIGNWKRVRKIRIQVDYVGVARYTPRSTSIRDYMGTRYHTREHLSNGRCCFGLKRLGVGGTGPAVVKVPGELRPIFMRVLLECTGQVSPGKCSF